MSSSPRIHEAVQVVLPQQESVFLLRDRQLFVGKLKQKNKYYMLMDACQERDWGAFNGACQTQNLQQICIFNGKVARALQLLHW